MMSTTSDSTYPLQAQFRPGIRLLYIEAYMKSKYVRIDGRNLLHTDYILPTVQSVCTVPSLAVLSWTIRLSDLAVGKFGNGNWSKPSHRHSSTSVYNSSQGGLLYLEWSHDEQSYNMKRRKARSMILVYDHIHLCLCVGYMTVVIFEMVSDTYPTINFCSLNYQLYQSIIIRRIRQVKMAL